MPVKDEQAAISAVLECEYRVADEPAERYDAAGGFGLAMPVSTHHRECLLARIVVRRQPETEYPETEHLWFPPCQQCARGKQRRKQQASEDL